jgi:hypothetical protein
MANWKRSGGFILGALAASALAGCGALSTLESQTDSVAQALNTVSTTANAPESAGLARGPRGFKPETAEGFRCDSSPDITYVEVCGQQLPATVHLEWTDCAAPERPGHCLDGGMDGPPAGAPPDGPPPERDGGHPGAPGMMGPGGGPRGHGGPGGGGRGGEGHGPSSGTADITYTYSTPDGCAGAILQDQAASFDVSRTAPDGAVSRSVGTSTSEAQLVPDGHPLVKSMHLDVTRTLSDGTGAVQRSVHVVGNRTVSFSSDVPPTATANGSYTESFSDGTTSSTTEVDVVQPPRDVCPWPTSGTLTRVAADGTSHVLAYGPTCGSGTLDGQAVDLSIRRHGGERQGAPDGGSPGRGGHHR